MLKEDAPKHNVVMEQFRKLSGCGGMVASNVVSENEQVFYLETDIDTRTHGLQINIDNEEKCAFCKVQYDDTYKYFNEMIIRLRLRNRNHIQVLLVLSIVTLALFNFKEPLRLWFQTGIYRHTAIMKNQDNQILLKGDLSQTKIRKNNDNNNPQQLWFNPTEEENVHMLIDHQPTYSMVENQQLTMETDIDHPGKNKNNDSPLQMWFHPKNSTMALLLRCFVAHIAYCMGLRFI